MDLGQRIHRLRLSRGLTQRDLAGDRYTAAYVSSVESGKRTPSGDALRYFADQLGVNDEELVTGRPADAATALELAFTAALAEATASDAATASSRAAISGGNMAAAEDRALPDLAAPERGEAEGGGTAEGNRRGFAAVAEEARELSEGKWLAWALLELDPLAHAAEAAELLEAESPLDRIPLVLAQAAAAEPRYAIFLLEQARDELIQQGFPDPDARHALLAHLAARYLELDDDQRAAAAAKEALALIGPSDGAGYLTTARSLLDARRRNEATVALGQARAAFRRARLGSVIAACHRARGWQHRDAGELHAAATDLARARELYSDTGLRLDTAVELAEVQRRLGFASAAEALLALVLTREEDSVPLRIAHARRETGLLALDRGEDEEAERQLRGAVEIYWSAGTRRDLARTLALLGNLLNGQSRAAEAAEVLHEGLLRLENLAR